MDRVEISTRRAFLLEQIERLRDSLSSLQGSRRKLTTELESLSPGNLGQLNTRREQIESELASIIREISSGEKRLGRLDSEVEGLRSMEAVL
jgi:chromosome segregation ATPase